MDVTRSPAPTDRQECGFLLIADMESSTASKHELGVDVGYAALRRHNRLVVAQTQSAPRDGEVLNSLGDAVVIKYPVAGSELDAMSRCVSTACSIVDAFEKEPPLRRSNGEPFYLRSKILLQYYEAFRYESGDNPVFARELVGEDIDTAFRLAPIAWRLQILVTERFVQRFIALSNAGEVTDPGPASLLDAAHQSRHLGAQGGTPLRGIDKHLSFNGESFWLTDAREIARLKGISETRRLFALSRESPDSLIKRGQTARLTIKVRQDHHAIILATVSLARQHNENYIDHVVRRIRESSDGNRLDSELSLLAAAKIYGEFDFFFRVSCIDDASLQRFFNTIHDEAIGVSHVEVRSTVRNQLAITQQYAAITQKYLNRPYVLVLAWFERDPLRDTFALLRDYLHSATASETSVQIIEVGEVIHHLPVYAIFICESLGAYASFFNHTGLRQTSCRSHVGHIERPSDAQLRYSLMDGVYFPSWKNAPPDKPQA